MTIDPNKNRKYYDHFSGSDWKREDDAKVFWKQAIDFTFEGIGLNDKVVLEIGAGKGFLSKWFPAVKPKKIVYAEMSTNRIQACSYRYDLETESLGVINDGNQHCFKRDTFDIILLINVMMMINDKVEMVKRYQTLLKKRGVIAVIEVLDGNWFYRMNKIVDAKYKQLKI